MTINTDFFERDSAEVARDLLGCTLNKDGAAGKIVETEAYYGRNDPASHARNGPTERNRPMFGEPGKTYIYLCYGVHHLLNITTRKYGKPGAVLIRALEPTEGIEIMKERRGGASKKELTNGPGKVTEALGINRNQNGQTVVEGESTVKVKEGKADGVIETSKRIGVNREHDRELRFFCKNSEYVSR